MFEKVVPFFTSHVAQFPPTNTVAQYCLGHLGPDFIQHEGTLLVPLTGLVLRYPHQLRLLAPLYNPTCSHETYAQAYVTLVNEAVAHPEKAAVAIRLLPKFVVKDWLDIAAPDEVAAFQNSMPIGYDERLVDSPASQQLQLQVTSDYCLLMPVFFTERAVGITQQLVSTALSAQVSLSVWETLLACVRSTETQLSARTRLDCATALADAFLAHRRAGHSVVDRLADALGPLAAIINLLVLNTPGKLTGLKLGDHSHIAFRCYDPLLCYAKAGQLVHDDTLQQLAVTQLDSPWGPTTSIQAGAALVSLTQLYAQPSSYSLLWIGHQGPGRALARSRRRLLVDLVVVFHPRLQPRPVLCAGQFSRHSTSGAMATLPAQ